MNNWISVEFAVPSNSRYVLVKTLNEWVDSNGKKRRRYNIHIGQRLCFKNGNIKWRGQGGGYICNDKSSVKVTHWMPLPELQEIQGE